jgi:transposase
MVTRKEQQRLEERRKEAMMLYETGAWTQKELAIEYHVHKRTIEKWVHNGREDRKHGLDLIPHRVPECHLNQEQLRELEKTLLKGSFELGFEDGLWTCPRISRLIKEKFGQIYHPASVAKVLHRNLGWSVQRPQTRAIERDAKAVQIWKKTEWPKILKKP